MATQQYSDPIHVTATCSIPPQGDNAPNAIALKNPLGLPMEVNEIKFRLRSTSQLLTGGTVSVKLDLGQIPLSSGFVPIFTCGRALSLESGEWTQINSGVDRVIEHVWKLPRPLFVPAGALIQPIFRHNGLVSSAITAQVSYAGRSMWKGYRPSGKMAVPWVAAYVSKVFSSTAIDTDVSSEKDIVNPFDASLNLSYFVGRIVSFNNDANTIPIYSDPGYLAEGLRVRMVTSQGDPIVPHFAPFGAVFMPVTHSWECEVAVPGNSYIQALLDQLAPANGYDTQAFISMVGWREVGGY